MPDRDDTSIRVSKELADRLWNMKDRGQSYEDVIWSLIDERESGRETRESAPEPTRDETPTATRARDQPSQDGRERLGAAVADLDVPGSGELADARREAIASMAELLRERGTAEKSDMLAVVDPDAVGYASEASVWSNLIKGKDTLTVIDGVQKPPEGRSTWRWVGKN
jgi:hypothetical protein